MTGNQQLSNSLYSSIYSYLCLVLDNMFEKTEQNIKQIKQ